MMASYNSLDQSAQGKDEGGRMKDEAEKMTGVFHPSSFTGHPFGVAAPGQLTFGAPIFLFHFD
jgi:hypothetical protein